jgi:hypothetical protein
MALPILILHANRRDFSQSALEKTMLVVCKKNSVGDKKEESQISGSRSGLLPQGENSLS